MPFLKLFSFPEDECPYDVAEYFILLSTRFVE